MVKDIPFELRLKIAKHMDNLTLNSLRLVCFSWSQAAAVFLFRTLRVQVGREGDFEHHKAMSQKLSFIAPYCDELYLILPGKTPRRDHHNFPQDLELLASMFGGHDGIQILGLENAWWPSEFNSATATIAPTKFHDWTQDVDIPSLFPAVTSLRFFMMRMYPLPWLASLLSSWPNLHTLDMKMNTVGQGIDGRITFSSQLTSLKLLMDVDPCDFITPGLPWVLAAPAGAVKLQCLDVEIKHIRSLVSVIEVLVHTQDTIKHLRLGVHKIMPDTDANVVIRAWKMHESPGITSLVLNSRAHTTNVLIYRILDATNMISLEHLRLEFNLAGRRCMPPHYREPCDPPPTSLEHFPRLQRISVSYEQCGKSATSDKRMTAALTVLPILAQARERGRLAVEHYMVPLIKEGSGLKLEGRKEKALNETCSLEVAYV